MLRNNADVRRYSYFELGLPNMTLIQVGCPYRKVFIQSPRSYGKIGDFGQSTELREPCGSTSVDGQPPRLERPLNLDLFYENRVTLSSDKTRKNNWLAGYETGEG